MLERIAITAARVDRARGAYIERVVDKGRELEVAASVGDAAPPDGLRVPYQTSFTEAALASGGGLIVSDLAESNAPMAKHIGAGSGRCLVLVNLLRAGGIVHGSLVLVRNDDEPYRAADVEQVRVFAVLASLALRSALMIEDAERRHRELQEVTKSRERLIRGFTHDVKNPLNAADGFAELLETGIISDPKQRAESIARIRGAKTALQLIDEIVELARAEDGQLSIHWREISLLDLAHKTLDDFQAAAEASDHELVDELPPQLPELATDPDRVRQILSNLLSNAIKYTPPGGRVRVRGATRIGRRDDDPTQWNSRLPSRTMVRVFPWPSREDSFRSSSA